MDLNPICHPLQPKKMKFSFWNMFNFWWSPGLVNGLKPHLPPLSSLKMKCSFLDYIQLLMIGHACRWTQTPSAIPLQPKNETLIFGIHSTSDDHLGWSMDSNPICHPSPAKKMKFSFLDYVHLWWSVGLVDGLEPHLPPLSSQKMKCSFLDYVQLLMIGRASASEWLWMANFTHLQLFQSFPTKVAQNDS